MKQFVLYNLVILALFLYSCSEVDLNPSQKQDKVYHETITNLNELKGISRGMYDRMTATTYYGRNAIIFNEVRSDNCFSNGETGRFVTVAAMNVSPEGNYSENTWADIYQVIASANIIIHQNPEIIEEDSNQINHIIGQAHIIRAWAHFDLLKIFGQQHVGGTLGIPYITEYISTYEGNQIAPSRDEVENNRDSIMADISAGLSLLQEDFNDASLQFITTHAAQALKARVALYFEDWETAKNAALNVVNSDSFQVATVSEYFNTWANDAAVNSIFELAFSTTDNLDFNSLSNIYRGSDYGDIEVLDNLLTIFDEDDIRIDSRMIGYEKIEEKELLRNLGKYPSANYSDNVSLIRYEEVILTLAEAKLELGENDALQYLNLIPAQRNAMPYKKATKENILKERRREFCFEGFRFDDLARTGQDIPLVSLKQTHGGPEYGSYKFAFPIPVAELNANPNMEQNSGY